MGDENKQIICFSLNDKVYGVNILNVAEIIDYRDPTSIPEMPDTILGVINLRGEIIPILNLHSKLSKLSSFDHLEKEKNIIIITVKNRRFGIITNEVFDIIKVEKKQIKPLLSVENNHKQDYYCGVIECESRIVTLLDFENLEAFGIQNITCTEDEPTSYPLLSDKEETKQVIAFRLGAEIYAIEIEYISEVIECQSITKIPQMPDYVLGMINLRGAVISVFDLKRKFSIKPYDITPQNKIILLEIEKNKIGLLVDEIIEIIKTYNSQIFPLQSIKINIDKEYVVGIGQTLDIVYIILDATKMYNKFITELEPQGLNAE